MASHTYLCDQAGEACVVALQPPRDLVDLAVYVVYHRVLLVQLLLHAARHIPQGAHTLLNALQLRILPHLGILPLLLRVNKPE
jgi:hypothetical protein